MPNKNTKKKRRRVVMTSDVVPAGSREEASAPEVKADEVVTSDVSTEPDPAMRDADEGVALVSSKSELIDAGENHADEVTEPAAPMTAALGGDEDDLDGADGASADVSENSDGSDRSDISDGLEEKSASGENGLESASTGALDGASDGNGFDENGASDEVTEPAAKQEELWSPEELEQPAVTVPAADVSRAHLKGLIEALVFVADQPVSLNDIAKAAGRADRKLVKALAEELRQEYTRRGIHLDEVAGGLIFRTNPAYGPFIRDAAAKKPVKMTRAQLETLAIIAYRQPLTRPEVDEVRGVDSGPVMKMLLERDLIKILGKKDEPGRPLLYGTTHAFLEFFGLKALKDLPSLREFTELNEDSRRVYDKEMADAGDTPTEPDLTTLAAAASGAAPATSAAPAETEAGIDADPATMRPAETSAGAWFERPTEPDTTVEALDPTSEADLQGSDEGDAREDDGVARTDGRGAREDDEGSDSNEESDSNEDEARAGAASDSSDDEVPSAEADSIATELRESDEESDTSDEESDASETQAREDDGEPGSDPDESDAQV